jgi:hypothetical protein
MDFESIIYNILNEDSDKIQSLKKAAGGQPLRTIDTYPSVKSSFSEGKVHEIAFKNIVDGQKRHYYVIYRKISKAEYDSLKRNYKINASIVPTDIEEHSKDIYYTVTKKYTATPRRTSKVSKSPDDEDVLKDPKQFESRTFIYLSKEQADLSNRDLPQEYKLELVPLKDIYEKGVGVRNMSLATYIEYIDSIENIKKAQKARAKAAIDLKPKKLKLADFFISPKIEEYIKSLVNNYTKKFNLSVSPEEKARASKKYEEVKKGLAIEIKKFIDYMLFF